MPAGRKHARQRRPDAQARGWLTPREFAEVRGCALRTVQYWCIQGCVVDRKGARVPVEGGDGHDYRIPLRAIADPL